MNEYDWIWGKLIEKKKMFQISSSSKVQLIWYLKKLVLLKFIGYENICA